MSWQDPDEGGFDPRDDGWEEPDARRWPLVPHGLYPRERWLWFEQLWTDVCILREPLPAPRPIRVVGGPGAGRGARRARGVDRAV